MQIHFIHDFHRAEWDGGMAERSGRWLYALVAPLLRRIGHHTTRIGLYHPAIQTLLARTLRAHQPGMAPHWPTLFSDPEAAHQHAGIFPCLTQAGLVVGFELSPNQMRILDAAGIPFVDVAIDPIRFAADLFLALRTNDPSLAHALAPHAAPSAPIALEARRLCLPAADEPAAATLFVGQTDVDAALVTGACLGTVDPHLPALRHRFGDGDRLLLKPHPYGRAHRDILTLHQTFPKARLVDDNVYALLGSGTVAEVVTLSSSVATEAPFFGVPATTLLRPDTSQVDGVSPRIRLLPEAMCCALRATATRAVAGASRRKMSLRSRLGLAWAYPPPLNPPDRRIKPDDILDFSCHGRPGLHGFGWSHPEPTGCWTDGPLATFLVDPAGQSLDLVLNCRACLPPGAAPLQVTLEVRGAAVPPQRLSFYWPRPRMITVALPPMKGLLEVALHIMNPRSPASAGRSDDCRALGLHVATVKVRCRPAARLALFPHTARAMAASIAAALIGG